MSSILFYIRDVELNGELDHDDNDVGQNVLMAQENVLNGQFQEQELVHNNLNGELQQDHELEQIVLNGQLEHNQELEGQLAEVVEHNQELEGQLSRMWNRTI